jgi:methylisocitrate lyase
MNMASATPELLRAMLSRGAPVVAPGAYDPYSALLIESLGFEAVYLGGNALGLQLGVGQPFVTLTETADAVHRISRFVKAPLVVDAGAGFGDAAHAAIAMRALGHAGAAALHIDDQRYPKRAHYHRGRGRLEEATVVADKLRAMRDAARGAGPLLIARTDAWRVTGSMDDTIERCRSYAAAGAEAVMVLDLGPDQAPHVRQALPDVPLVWIGGIAEPVPTTAQLQAAGFAMTLYPFNSIGAVTESLLATWRALQADGRPPVPVAPASQTLRQALALIGMDAHLKIESQTTERALDAPAGAPNSEK